jgi:hypothetical protein
MLVSVRNRARVTVGDVTDKKPLRSTGTFCRRGENSGAAMGGEPVDSTSETLGRGVTPQEQSAQLTKVLRSAVFRSAPGLQKFLEYVASKAIEGLSHEIKEYTIGSEVFERTGAYDPKIDTTVRVQAHRLREKLKEYYEGEGAKDEILLEMPKGHYVPYFSRRPVASSARSSSLGNAVQSSADSGSGQAGAVGPTHGELENGSARNRVLRVVGGMAGLAAILALALLFPTLRNRTQGNASAVSSAAVSPSNSDGPLKMLWADFLRAQSRSVVAYSNTAFLTTQTSDLLRLKSDETDDLGSEATTSAARRLVSNPLLLERAGPVFFQDVYTGTGEVIGVFHLTQMFGQMQRPLGIKRTRLITTDDLTHEDLIFLGSTRENELLQKLPLVQDFVFDWPANLRAWSGKIVNLRPQHGESAFYEVERDPKTQALRADYALVSFLPGVTANRRIAILGGLTTLGTQAAAEFATSASQVADLDARLGMNSQTASANRPTYFQVVLRIEIMKGDILQIKYITGHVIRSSQYPDRKN